MKITVGQLRQVITEALDGMPPRSVIEDRLHDAKYDEDSAARALSALYGHLPANHRPLVGELHRAVEGWVAGRLSWNVVGAILDKIYGLRPAPAQEPFAPKQSYVRMKAANRHGQSRVA